MTDSTKTLTPETFVRNALDKDRWEHTQGVCSLASKLGRTYKIDPDPLRTAALFHDNARSLPDERQYGLAKQFRGELDQTEENTPALWHAPAGAQRMIDHFDYDRSNPAVQAVAFHSTGAPDQGGCLKGLLIADFAEENRSFDEAEDVRSRIGSTSLNELARCVLRHKLTYILKEDKRVHPRTIKAYNQLCA
ncbi:MAG: bis(5'-nucleosyl)-tetraphosphatase (symmetrical) YqeK [bacterium]